MTLDPYGLRRVIAPAGALPQRADRLDPGLPLGEDELSIAVEALAVDAASFALSAGFLVGVSARERPRDPSATAEPMLHDLRVGFAELVGRPWLLIIMGASGISLMAVLGTLSVLGPLVADQHLGGARAWGLVLGALAFNWGYLLTHAG